MVTVRKAEGMPALSEICAPGKGEMAVSASDSMRAASDSRASGSDARGAASDSRASGSNSMRVGVRLSALGGIINSEIHNLGYAFPSVRTFDYVIMPDHVHFIVYLTENGKCHLGDVVKHLKSAVSVAWHRLQGRGEDMPVEPVFMEGYHDRYSRDSRHLNSMKRYVRDNPRRLMIKRYYPEYFRQRRKIAIDGKIYVMIGNPFLILHPFIEAAIYSSRCSLEENRKRYERCVNNIGRGGVTIGTFFAHSEKVLRDMAIGNGCSVILMHGNGFDKLYAPPQPYFDLCMEGRCLIIGEEIYRTAATADVRAHNRAMNVVAARIASGEALLSRPPQG